MFKPLSERGLRLGLRILPLGCSLQTPGDRPLRILSPHLLMCSFNACFILCHLESPWSVKTKVRAERGHPVLVEWRLRTGLPYASAQCSPEPLGLATVAMTTKILFKLRT